jgi:hypothetical protein
VSPGLNQARPSQGRVGGAASTCERALATCTARPNGRRGKRLGRAEVGQGAGAWHVLGVARLTRSGENDEAGKQGRRGGGGEAGVTRLLLE